MGKCCYEMLCLSFPFALPPSLLFIALILSQFLLVYGILFEIFSAPHRQALETIVQRFPQWQQAMW